MIGRGPYLVNRELSWTKHFPVICPPVEIRPRDSIPLLGRRTRDERNGDDENREPRHLSEGQPGSVFLCLARSVLPVDDFSCGGRGERKMLRRGGGCRRNLTVCDGALNRIAHLPPTIISCKKLQIMHRQPCIHTLTCSRSLSSRAPIEAAYTYAFLFPPPPPPRRCTHCGAGTIKRNGPGICLVGRMKVQRSAPHTACCMAVGGRGKQWLTREEPGRR